MTLDPGDKTLTGLVDHRASHNSDSIELKINGVWVKASPKQVFQLSDSLAEAAKYADSTTSSRK